MLDLCSDIEPFHHPAYHMLLAALAILAGMIAGIAQAQTPDRLALAKPDLTENFDGRVPVSGRQLVGLWLGRPEGPFRIADLRIQLEPPLTSKRVCLALSSRDGRYTSENEFVASSRLPTAGLVYPTKFGATLVNYNKLQVAPLVRDVQDCIEPALGVVRPATFVGVSNSRELIAALNADPRLLNVQLKQGGKSIATADCVGDATVTSIKFSAICSVKLPDGPHRGLYVLEVISQGTFKKYTALFDIALEVP
jgi:hypothetical protein